MINQSLTQEYKFEINHVIYRLNRLNAEDHVTISIDIEKRI